ncbi:MAG: helix-hairpin-helix domain-containing protein [bacterium]|nr:helix-hairpin-helix domain-containing protein [bacterium]
MIKLAVIVCISKTLIGAFEYRNSSPESLYPFYTAVSEYAVQGLTVNPAYLARQEGAYIAFSANNPYSLEGLYTGTARIGYGFSRAGVQVAWNRFGIPEYQENLLEANAGYMPFRFLSAGIGVSYYNLTIDTEEIEESMHFADIRASILCVPFSWLELSYLQENILSYVKTKREDFLFPEFSAGIALKPIKGFSFVWNINRTAFGYMNTFSVSAHILSFLSVKGGYCRESASYSAAVSIVYKQVSVSYGLQFHPHLGNTHSVGVALTGKPVAYESLDYLKKFHDNSVDASIKKIDINTCSLEDLLVIPGLEALFAERIIKYRTAFGEVSEKSLYQVGMETRDITRLLNYIYGLAGKKTKKKDSYKKRKWKKWKREKKYKRGYTRKKRQAVFNKLLLAGVDSSTAFKLSELVKIRSKGLIFSLIDSMKDLDAQKKEEIKRICADSL